MSSRSTSSTPTPGISSSAFAVGSSRVVERAERAVAAGGGMLAAGIGGAQPAARHPLPRPARRDRTARGRCRRAPSALADSAGLACLAAAVAILLAAPQLAIVGMLSLTLALLRPCCLRPLGADARARQAPRVGVHQRGPARRRDGAARRAGRARSRSPRPARSRYSAASRSRARTPISSTALKTRRTT